MEQCALTWEMFLHLIFCIPVRGRVRNESESKGVSDRKERETGLPEVFLVIGNWLENLWRNIPMSPHNLKSQIPILPVTTSLLHSKSRKLINGNEPPLFL